MNSVCVITDSTAQFPKPNFNGQQLVNVIPLEININNTKVLQYSDYKASHLPKTANLKENPELLAPSVERLRKVFINLSQSYETIFGIFLSGDLNDCFQNALEAAEAVRGKTDIQIIDSKTTSVGLGILVQRLVEAVLRGDNATQIDRQIRSMIPHTYTLFCTPSLSYLHHNGFIDYSQTMISEMLGILPIFTLEDGRITPIEKVRSRRHALNYFQEFLEEFVSIYHIAFIQSAKPNFKDAKIFHENAKTSFPDTGFTKHIINLPLSILFGPRSNGLIVCEYF